MIEIEVCGGEKRIDRVIRKELNFCSLGEIFRLFRTEKILINGKKCKESDRVNSDDEILILADENELRKQSVQKIKTANKNNFRLIYEDENLLVCDKPFGLACQPGKGISTGASLIELAQNYAKQKFIPYLIHRIDADTSGVILIAKNVDFLRNLQKIWGSESVKKEYAALCFGNFTQKSGKIELNLKKTSNEGGGMKMKAAQNGGLYSVSKYEVVSQNEHCALVFVEIQTGRTHQIRTHFSHINHHLLGDKRYGNVQNDGKIEKIFGEKISRLMLHSRKISFALSKKKYEFESQIPDVFYKFAK